MRYDASRSTPDASLSCLKCLFSPIDELHFDETEFGVLDY